MDIYVKGDIVSDDEAWIYDWLGFNYTSPKLITNKLLEANGEDINIKINTPGGDVFAASEIYTSLREYKGNVTTDIVGIAASAGSVIAMAGKTTRMSPTAQIMIHNVSSCAKGDYRDMNHMSDILKNANDTIANAYMCKTGMTREKALEIMNNETWLSATKAKELGLIDEIMFSDTNKVNLSQVEQFRNKINNGFYNSCTSIPRDVIENLIKNLNFSSDKNADNENQPTNSEVDFLLQQKAKAQLNLMKIGGIKYV